MLLFFLAHCITAEHWTFVVLAANHKWDSKEKARCCHNAAVFYAWTSAMLWMVVFIASDTVQWRWKSFSGRRWRRSSARNTARGALLSHIDPGSSVDDLEMMHPGGARIYRRQIRALNLGFRSSIESLPSFNSLA